MEDANVRVAVVLVLGFLFVWLIHHVFDHVARMQEEEKEKRKKERKKNHESN